VCPWPSCPHHYSQLRRPSKSLFGVQRVSLASLGASNWLGLRLQLMAALLAGAVAGAAVMEHQGLIPGTSPHMAAGEDVQDNIGVEELPSRGRSLGHMLYMQCRVMSGGRGRVCLGYGQLQAAWAMENADAGCGVLLAAVLCGH
jgi:hypothetical protein